MNNVCWSVILHTNQTAKLHDLGKYTLVIGPTELATVSPDTASITVTLVDDVVNTLSALISAPEGARMPIDGMWSGAGADQDTGICTGLGATCAGLGHKVGDFEC
jgi:hypothetical protein